MKMPKLAKDWVKALRSGKYRQIQNRLKQPGVDGFCCLGVVCEISGFGKWMDGTAHYASRYKIGDTKGADSLLPKKVRLALGIPVKFQNKLISLNDEAEESFAGIADAIEAWYKAA